MFIVVLFTIAHVWKQSNCPSKDEWIKKICIYTICSLSILHTHTHTHTMEYYLVMKKNKVLPFANNVDGLGGYYAKPSKSDRERQIYMTYTESKKIKLVKRTKRS